MTNLKNDPILHDMYAWINNIITKVENKYILHLCGNFNAKKGKSTIKEQCVCKYSRGF